MEIVSTAFKDGEAIPKKYAGDGDNLSPALIWRGTPKGTREMALICDDPDAPMEKPFVHWVLYKIPAAAGALAESDNAGATEGKNSRGAKGYTGPMPPPGHGTHHYHFKLYALDKRLDLSPGATKEELLEAIEGHVLEQQEVVGTYER